MEIGFVTPMAALAALAVLLPFGALGLRERGARRVRRTLGLSAPPRRARLGVVAALLVAFLLLGAAAAQPTVRTASSVDVRGDAQLFVVFDVTRSMLAAADPGSPTRLERARAFALRLRDSLTDVPTGVATITNRPLPHLFPTADPESFAATVTGAIGVNRPPPALDVSRRATSFESLEALASDNFFHPDSIRRLAVLVTDAETQPFAPRALADRLEEGGIELLVVRFWDTAERIWLPDGAFDEGYRPDPLAQRPVTELAALTAGMRVFDEGELPQVVAAARAYLGEGTPVAQISQGRPRPLAPYLFLASLVAMAAALGRSFAATPGSKRAILHTVWFSRAEDPRGRGRARHEERERGRDGTHPDGDRRRPSRARPPAQGGRARARAGHQPHART